MYLTDTQKDSRKNPSWKSISDNWAQGKQTLELNCLKKKIPSSIVFETSRGLLWHPETPDGGISTKLGNVRFVYTKARGFIPTTLLCSHAIYPIDIFPSPRKQFLTSRKPRLPFTSVKVLLEKVSGSMPQTRRAFYLRLDALIWCFIETQINVD